MWAVSCHLVGQAVADKIIDGRHKAILPPHVWGDGEPENVRQRAADEVVRTAEAAHKLGLEIVTGFTGSPIWHLFYSWPPNLPEDVEAGFREAARRWTPILDRFEELGVRFALEVHPSEIAFDGPSWERALDAFGGHPAFGVNFDPSHFGYQNADYVGYPAEARRPRVPRPHEGRLVVGRAGRRPARSAGTPSSGTPAGRGTSGASGAGGSTSRPSSAS